MIFFRRRKRGGKFIAVFAVFLGLYLVYSGWNLKHTAKASLRWPTVLGRIKSSEIIKNEPPPSSKKRAITYSPEVVFEYTIDGQTYQANQVYIGQGVFSTPEAAAEITGKYSPDTLAMISYNSRKPHIAVLEAGNQQGNEGNMFFGGGFIVLILGLLGVSRSPDPSE